MNLIEESIGYEKEKKGSKLKTIILICIIIIVLAIIGMVSYLVYVKSTILTVTLDGNVNGQVKELLVIEDNGKVYIPIKKIASFFSYSSFDGEYKAKSESKNQCYVQSENEVANFELGSNKIYKLNLNSESENYEYVYADEPVKAINGELYATADAIEKGYNVSFDYNQKNNKITILTMPYLISDYKTKVLDYGYSEIDSEFVNQKTVLKDILVVIKKETKEQYGVITVDGKTILEPKYDKITYMPEVGDFLVESNKKVGIISTQRETKVQIIYDSISLMDSDNGLYVAKKNNKYGVIDIRGNTRIYIENDEIGVDLSRFSENEVMNKYLLVGNLIPARKDKYWGLYNKNGELVADFEYDSFGYIASNNKNALNLLVIPNYDVVVACKDKKYTLINSSGEKLFEPRADDIYMTISEGKKHYYIAVNDRSFDAEEYLNQIGVKPITSNNSNNAEENNTNTNNSTNTNSNKDSNVENNIEENSNQNNNSENNEKIEIFEQ